MEYINGILGLAGIISLVVVVLILTVFYFVRHDRKE